MMEEFKQMLLKRQKEQVKKPVDKDKLAAKANMMKELSGLLGKDMAGDMGSLKKVTVASDSKEGLEAGLEKAKDVIEKKPDMGDMLEGLNDKHKDPDSIEESDESPEEESSESESEESIEDEIKKLEEKLAEMKAKKA